MRLIYTWLLVLFSVASCSCQHVKIHSGDNQESYTLRVDNLGDGIWALDLHGPVTVASMDALIKAMDMANEDPDCKGVLIEINSEGGQVDPGLLGAKAIERATEPVACVVDGEADSMAFYLLQSCQYRIVTSRSTVMLHNPIANFRGSWSSNWREMRNWADRFEKYQHGMCEHYTRRMTLTANRCDEIFAQHDGEWWMTAQEAHDESAVDEVVDTFADAKPTMQKWMATLPQPTAEDAGTSDAGN